MREQRIERYIMMFFLCIMLGLFWYYDIFQIRTFDGNYNDAYVSVNGIDIGMDIAKTEKHLEQGFSGRKQPALNQGVLFDFGSPIKSQIWMKDMNFSLDILWISEDWEIISIYENISPDTYPTTFTSTEKTRYVLELPATAAKNLGLSPGLVLDYLGE